MKDDEENNLEEIISENSNEIYLAFKEAFIEVFRAPKCENNKFYIGLDNYSYGLWLGFVYELSDVKDLLGDCVNIINIEELKTNNFMELFR